MKALPLALAVLAGVTYSSQANLTITGGGFGAGSAPGDILDVPAFFESSIASYNYNDYTTGHPDHFSVNTTRKLALDWGVDGYVYQDLGLWSGETSLTLGGDSLIRDAFYDSRTGYERYRDRTDMGTCDLSLWDMNPAAVGANGSKPADLGGVLLDSFFLDASALTYTADTSTFWHSFNISGTYSGDHIWLMIEKNATPGANAYLGAEYEVLLDNLVPEPTSVALLGMAAAAGLIFRRRKA